MGETEKQALQDLIQPLLAQLREVDLADPVAAKARVDEIAPVAGELVLAIRAAMVKGIEAGWLVPKEMGGNRFGRVSKDLEGFSVDAVVMSSAGPAHRHPNGEINLLFTTDGKPEFDGWAPGWACYAPGSVHVPNVIGGEMMILYLLPGGAIEWVKDS